MGLDRQLARFLAAAIVLIAAYLAPSAVQAHAGHHHEALIVAVSSDAIPAPNVVSPSSHAATLPTALVAGAEAMDAVIDVADPNARTPLETCPGWCCAGTACCAHAAVADGNNAALLEAAKRFSATPDDLARFGIGPEALPKPPRSFA